MDYREQRLAQLEASTTGVVKLVAELRGERDRLRRQLQETERETVQLRKDVTALRRERDVVRSRLLSIDESLSKALATDPALRSGKKGSARTDESVVGELTLFS
jgi:uncharacterized coiled-coil DUF342 family protein